MPRQRQVGGPRAKRGRNRSKAAKKKDESAYAPKKRVQANISEANTGLKLSFGREIWNSATPEPTPEVRTTRGRAVKPNSKYTEAITELIRGGDEEELEEVYGLSDHDDDSAELSGFSALNQMQGLGLLEQLEEDDTETDANTDPSVKSVPKFRQFARIIHKNVVAMYETLIAQPEIQMELPDFMEANPDAVLKDNPDEDVVKPWVTRELFHLYILAYQGKQYSICDLVADTWIREFQAMDSKDKTKIWMENKSSFFREQFRNPPANDNGSPSIAQGAMRFDIDRIKELYQYTRKDCGARLIWADAMALCGKGLDPEPSRYGNSMDINVWPEQLVKDVCLVSLRSLRTRLTLKIEEPFPEEWCERYHEHTKHNQPCYRKVYQEMEARKAEEAAAKAAEAAQSSDTADEMDVDTVEFVSNAGKRVSFAE